MISLVLLSRIMNRGNTDMTVDMASPSMPRMVLLCDEIEFNEMHPYAEEMDIRRMNEHITPLDDSRSLRFRLEMYGNGLERLTLQLRSLQDGRLIEESPVFDYAKDKDNINGSVSLKDLIKEGVSYSLCFLVECTDGRLLRYYTRLVRMPESGLKDKLAFALYFHETSFDKAKAKQELPTYLESNSKGDNSSFTHVDIHSSVEQVSWGNLELERVGTPSLKLRDIDNDMAQLRISYILRVMEGDQQQYCFAEEYYRIRIGRERIHLLEYERSLEEVFDDDRAVIVGNKIQLGMVSDKLQKEESPDGHVLAFVSCGRLFTYNADANRFSYVFGFYDLNMTDPRATLRDNDIRIFSVDETGDVSFAVWGYMNCGNHEGMSGVVIYQYDCMLNTVEEQIFIPFYGDYEHLKRNTDRLCYAGERGFYLLMDDDIYEFGLNGRSVNLLAQDIPLASVVSSEKQDMLAWGNGSSLSDSDTIFVRNLARGSSGSILSEAGEKLMPITFFGSDLVYGTARDEDITQDKSGHEVFPMYSISIRSQNGSTLKEYSIPDVYVTSVEQGRDMISLGRMRKTDNGFTPIEDDQIMNTTPAGTGRNTLESVVTERFETIQQLSLRGEVKLDTMQIMKPRLVLFEGERRLKLTEAGAMPDSWELLLKGRLDTSYSECYEAVQKAYENGGTVQDQSTVIYRKTALPTKNQIMAIKGPVGEVGDEARETQLLAACIDTWMNYLGVEVHSFGRLYKGENVKEVITDQLPQAEVLDLSGVSLDAVLYFLANEMPVLVELEDGSGMLLVGYNELNVVVMNPARDDSVYKIGKKDATALFEAGGNRFTACILKED